VHGRTVKAGGHVKGAVESGPRERSMHGHRLRSIFYTACNAEPSVGAQWMIGGAMRAAAAADSFRSPYDDFIQQAHASLVRDMSLDPGAV
jgi:hypothetical protein